MKTWCKGALYIMNKLVVLIFLSVFSVSACSNEQCARSLEVTATAYTSSPDETNDEPTIAAWGDELKPGMNVIAVSRDLIDLGLDHGTIVSIEELDEEFIVADKMNKRWEKKIDIYMGFDKHAAREWGKREVTLCY